MLLGAQNADAFLLLSGHPVGGGDWLDLLRVNKLRELICIILLTAP